MTPGELLRTVRRRRGLTQADLAWLARTSQPAVSAYEHGHRDPTFGTLAKLIAACGEQLRIDASLPPPDLPPPATPEEHARRLLDVLSVADGIPTRPTPPSARGASARLDVTTLSLAERIVTLDHALSAIPHAFGGALALAYYAEPRATNDINLNVFVPAERFAEVAAPLVEIGARADDPEVAELVRRDGQAWVWWEDTPVELFFAYDRFRDAAAAARRDVPFADTTIPILAAEHLAVCKAVYSRAKDWVDLDAMLAAGTTIDAAEVLRWVGRIAGDTDPRYNRIAAALLTR